MRCGGWRIFDLLCCLNREPAESDFSGFFVARDFRGGSFNCGSWLASDSGLTGDRVLANWVNIRFFGCCRWRFRPYGDSLFYKRLKK
jgi:hypothetical protein